MATAKKPDPMPPAAPPVTMQDENVQNRRKSAFRKASSTSRAATNILQGGSYGSGKSTLG